MTDGTVREAIAKELASPASSATTGSTRRSSRTCWPASYVPTAAEIEERRARRWSRPPSPRARRPPPRSSRTSWRRSRGQTEACGGGAARRGRWRGAAATRLRGRRPPRHVREQPRRRSRRASRPSRRPRRAPPAGPRRGRSRSAGRPRPSRTRAAAAPPRTGRAAARPPRRSGRRTPGARGSAAWGRARAAACRARRPRRGSRRRPAARPCHHRPRGLRLGPGGAAEQAAVARAAVADGDGGAGELLLPPEGGLRQARREEAQPAVDRDRVAGAVDPVDRVLVLGGQHEPDVEAAQVGRVGLEGRDAAVGRELVPHHRRRAGAFAGRRACASCRTSAGGAGTRSASRCSGRIAPASTSGVQT